MRISHLFDPTWRVMLTVMLTMGLLAAPRAVMAQSPAIVCTSGYALWANGTGRDETMMISGSDNEIEGLVRSNADLRLSGSNNRITGIAEYVTRFEDGGDNNRYDGPTRVSVSLPPVSYQIADYRPGGIIATAAQAIGRYRTITGDFEVSEPTTLSGLYYVTGDVKLSASNIRGEFTIVAEGTIDVSGSDLEARPFADGLLLLSNKQGSGEPVIKLAGSDLELRGSVSGLGGMVELSGSDIEIKGMVLGEMLKLNGSDLELSFDAAFCPGSVTTPEAPPEEPPAEIEVGEEIVRRVEVINNVTFITIQIVIRNKGGLARDGRLVIDLGDDDDDDDDRFELVDIRFIEGIGFVHERNKGRVVIGLGQYNLIQRGNNIVVSITYRLRDGVRGDDDDDDDDRSINFKVRSRILFGDGRGRRAVVLPVIIIAVPVVVIVPQPRIIVVERLPVERIDLRFRPIWIERGGLLIFGLPLGEPRVRADGTIVQYFERARLELRPDGTITLGRLAAELGYATVPTVRFEDLDDDDRRWYTSATGHVIGAPFRNFWSRPLGLLIFGYPISGLFTDDDGYLAQCFERVCLQAFPEFAGTPYAIQLRLLGVELLERGDDDDDD
ncbi:MAG: hypothetical protein AB4911_08810 [Oscillochloridaceae bacterium umkhey_bin13]